MYLTWIELLGIAGAAILLVAFALIQLQKWNEEMLRYDIANAIGAGLLVMYALFIWSIPFAVLNGVWFVIALRDVITTLYQKQHKKHKWFFCRWIHK